MGGFELERGGATVSLPMSAQRLLAFVALQRKPVARVYVAGRLWPDSSDARAGASLRSALWRVQRAAGGVVKVTSHTLELAPEVVVDAHRVSVIAHAVFHRTGPLDGHDMAELCGSDDLLPDWYEDWIAIERERFRQIRLHALEYVCRRLTAAGDFGDALDAGLAALRAEPLRESVHRALIGTHLAEGNVGEALRQYQTCETLMSTELGVRPSRQTLRVLEDGIDAQAGRELRDLHAAAAGPRPGPTL